MFDTRYEVYLADTAESRALHHQIRYEVFCIERGFEDPEAFAQGQEHDRWDDSSHHFVVQDKESGAGVAAARHERQKLERLCRYIARPAIAEPRLSLTPSGNVRYQLKTPYRDGTTHVIFEPLDFMARLAALVPRPRVNLTHYHGVFIFIMSLMSVAAD